jgi:plastocyanin
MWLSRPAVIVFASAAAVATGCGGGDSPVVDRDGNLQLRLDEYRILPAQLAVRPGRIHIVAINDGVLTHNVVVQVPAESEEEKPRELARTETAHAGQTVTADVVLKPGTYRLACTIGNHVNLGQFATLEVRER